jgi:enolase
MKAVANAELIGRRLNGMALSQADIDTAMLKLDATPSKKRLGANAILGVSMAVTRLQAALQGIPLHQEISRLSGSKPLMPLPFANIINGGRHAGTGLKIQEFMICPTGERSFARATQSVVETYHTLKSIASKRYGHGCTNVGDEGGFALPVTKAEEALTLLQSAIKAAGYEDRMHIAMDCAASEFYRKGAYDLEERLTSSELGAYYQRLINRFGIISIEDAFDQDDHKAWSAFTRDVKAQVVGDDLLVTNPDRIAAGIKGRMCNALLLKVNQIGTVTEALTAAQVARKAGWNVMVSHRSGETEDSFISDLSVGLGCGQIKLGAPCRGERTAKYNQLLRIEEDSGFRYAKF